MRNFLAITKWILILLVGASMFSCQVKSEYQRMKARELASGVQQDSLFLGMYLGMTRDSFFKHCWELNKQEILTHGQMNISVEYKLAELRPSTKMNFYPNFYQDKIYEMPVLISDSSWAPWNKSASSDSIKTEVKELMEDWYGKGFIKVEHPTRGMAWVKVDGNRRISIYRQDDRNVRVVFTDLNTEDLAQAERKEQREAAKAQNNETPATK